MDCYKIENLTFTYPGRADAALDNLSLTIGAGSFVVIAGPSGCGKTTLLRRLKPSLAPHGRVSGAIYFEGAPVESLDARTESAKIGFVMQNPDNQIVTDKVWHELAFGLESLGCDTPSIRLRVAETASFFGIQTWFHMNVAELSGGQKQLLCLASIMTMRPSALILDEPTSQLDPIAASEFLAALSKINRELGVTIIITEHRLEEVFPIADDVMILDGGRLYVKASPQEVGAVLKRGKHALFYGLPVPMRVFAAVENSYACPVTVRDGRGWLDRMLGDRGLVRGGGDGGSPAARSVSVNDCAVEFDDVWFRYEKNRPDVIKGLSFKAYAGEITAVLGGNGTGKTTALSLISGIYRPYRGKVTIEGARADKINGLFDGLLGVLPQNPQSLFVRNTVLDDLLEIYEGTKIDAAQRDERIRAAVAECRLETLLQFHPYDLSGGEQQRAALAKILLLNPRILLLDEPTKGLDAGFKLEFSDILKKLANSGAAVIIVSHDVEFCAEHADRCALFFDGNIVSENSPVKFFSGNNFYTSAANRMARHALPDAITARDIVEALGGDISVLSRSGPGDLTRRGRGYAGFEPEDPRESERDLLMLYAGNSPEVSAGNAPEAGLGAGSVHPGVKNATLGAASSAPSAPSAPGAARKLSKRSAIAALATLAAVPATIYAGAAFFGERRYYIISILILLEVFVPFALVFENRKPRARELVVIAVLCAIGVAGRTAFFMLPQFKPVVAIVIITGVAFGGETGFLVGALTGFVSNMFFGQGPWTPWQMFAFGTIGFVAGVLFRKGMLKHSRAALCIFGGLSAIVIYGFIINTSTIFIYQNNPSARMLWSAIIYGFPLDLVHAAATVIFLFIISEPMLEKLVRIKTKYGLL